MDISQMLEDPVGWRTDSEAFTPRASNGDRMLAHRRVKAEALAFEEAKKFKVVERLNDDLILNIITFRKHQKDYYQMGPIESDKLFGDLHKQSKGVENIDTVDYISFQTPSFATGRVLAPRLLQASRPTLQSLRSSTRFANVS
jgi:hypothetical protein